MNFARILFNLFLGALGGVLGNLAAAWLLQDVWQNTFTWPRLLGTVAGFVLVLLLLAWLDHGAQQALQRQPAPGVHGNVQIGNPLIHVIKGVNVYRNWQIGGGRIEVVEHPAYGQPLHSPASAAEQARSSVTAQQQQALKARRRELRIEQERLARAGRHDEAQQVTTEIARIDALLETANGFPSHDRPSAR